jgi:Cell division protein CrgA
MRKKEKPFVSEAAAHAAALPEESPKWLAPLMVAGFIVGLFWIVVFYISSTKYPIPHIGAWNMVVGFGFIAFGFSLATRWR